MDSCWDALMGEEGEKEGARIGWAGEFSLLEGTLAVPGQQFALAQRLATLVPVPAAIARS